MRKHKYDKLTDAEQERLLLEDLMSVGQFLESKKSGYRVARLSQDRYDQLSIYVPVKKIGVKVVVKFWEYPAYSLPQIDPKNQDELSWLVTKSIRDALSIRKEPIRLQDIMNTIFEIVGELEKRDSKSEQENVRRRGPNLIDRILGLFGKQEEIHYLEDKYQARFEEPNLHQEAQSGFYDPYETGEGQAEHRSIRVDVLQVNEVVMPQRIIEEIMEHFRSYKPNEYAFLCSGILRESGLAIVFDYYPGEMKVSTPIYCELTDRFIEKAIYDWIPTDHNLVLWGHVHPIEGPSHTDSSSFSEIAEWDRNIRRHGIINKRSIAMLVNANSHSVRLYDVHLHKPIKKFVVSSPRFYGYNDR